MSYNWLRHVVSKYPRTPIIIGGDFNAKSTTWGYAQTDGCGARLEETSEDCNLVIINDPMQHTRIGLHPRQQNSSPDLTLASSGIVRDWSLFTTTWGSDHYPTLLTLNGKRFRTRQRLPRIDWTNYRNMSSLSTPQSLEQIITTLQKARDLSGEQIDCDDNTPAMDAHMANLWKRAQTLTTRHLASGKRHRDLLKMRKQYKLIREYQRTLANEQWHSLCARLEKERGLSKLWQVYRGLSGKRKPHTHSKGQP